MVLIVVFLTPNPGHPSLRPPTFSSSDLHPPSTRTQLKDPIKVEDALQWISRASGVLEHSFKCFPPSIVLYPPSSICHPDPLRCVEINDERFERNAIGGRGGESRGNGGNVFTCWQAPLACGMRATYFSNFSINHG